MTQPLKSATLEPSRQAIDRAAHDRVTIRMREHPSLTRSATGSRGFTAENGVRRQVNPADAAQARLFETILQVEIAQLQQLVAVLNSGCGEDSFSDLRPPETLSELRARIEDVHRLLQRLRDRFPYRPALG